MGLSFFEKMKFGGGLQSQSIVPLSQYQVLDMLKDDPLKIVLIKKPICITKSLICSPSKVIFKTKKTPIK